MTTTLANPTPVDPAALDLLAFERTASVRSGMKAENCPHYTLDALYAAGKALCAAPRVKNHRDDLLTLPKDVLVERRKLAALLLEAHSQIRRGISFFRWDAGDVNTLLPSLYVPPSGRRPADTTTRVPVDLAALHQQLHAAETPIVLDPEDHPFSAE